MSNQPIQEGLLSKKEIKTMIRELGYAMCNVDKQKEADEIKEIIKKLRLWIKK